VAHAHCVTHDNCTLPTSCVILSSSTASRTIVHFRKLPELTAEDFSKIDVSQFGWIHFEGRSPESYSRMIERVVSCRTESDVSYRTESDERERRRGSWCPGVSVELEKRLEDSAQLASLADVVFFSKEYAQYRGYWTMEEAVTGFRSLTRPE
jgi:ketohexokinase